MGEKKVTLSAYTVKVLKEYRELNDKYEQLLKEMHDFELTHLGDDDALLCNALRHAINEIKDDVKNLEREKLEAEDRSPKEVDVADDT